MVVHTFIDRRMMVPVVGVEHDPDCIPFWWPYPISVNDIQCLMSDKYKLCLTNRRTILPHHGLRIFAFSLGRHARSAVLGKYNRWHVSFSWRFSGTNDIDLSEPVSMV